MGGEESARANSRRLRYLYISQKRIRSWLVSLTNVSVHLFVNIDRVARAKKIRVFGPALRVANLSSRHPIIPPPRRIAVSSFLVRRLSVASSRRARRRFAESQIQICPLYIIQGPARPFSERGRTGGGGGVRFTLATDDAFLPSPSRSSSPSTPFPRSSSGTPRLLNISFAPGRAVALAPRRKTHLPATSRDFDIPRAVNGASASRTSDNGRTSRNKKKKRKEKKTGK